MKKKFDCVEFQHQAGAKIHEETKDLSREEKIEYWHKKYQTMMRRRRQFRGQWLSKYGAKVDPHDLPLPLSGLGQGKARPKKFDCVKFQHDAALRIYEETKGMSEEQEIEYWRQKGEQSLRRSRESLKAAAKKPRRKKSA
jgi:hypothetical protein